MGSYISLPAPYSTTGLPGVLKNDHTYAKHWAFGAALAFDIRYILITYYIYIYFSIWASDGPNVDNHYTLFIYLIHANLGYWTVLVSDNYIYIISYLLDTSIDH